MHFDPDILKNVSHFNVIREFQNYRIILFYSENVWGLYSKQKKLVIKYSYTTTVDKNDPTRMTSRPDDAFDDDISFLEDYFNGKLTVELPTNMLEIFLKHNFTKEELARMKKQAKLQHMIDLNGSPWPASEVLNAINNLEKETNNAS